MNAIYLALDALFTRYLNQVKAETKQLPSVTFDPPWPSPCDVKQEEQLGNDSQNENEDEDEKKENLSYWKPASRINHALFDDLEQALELSFRDDFKQFYGSFWSNGICVEREDINFSLIQIWNEEDQEKLKENILGHAFAKLKSKQPLNYFIGCTFGDDVICIDHESGEVVLEKPGRKTHKVLAPSLEAFLLSLSPTLDEYNG
jgi:SecY interacting protein Syd